MINKGLIWSDGAMSSSCEVLEWPRGDIPHPRSGAAPALCWTGSVETPQIQRQKTPVRWSALEWLWGDNPHPRAKEKPQQDVGRGEFVFRIKSHSCQRCSEGSNKPCGDQDPGTPQRLRQNCVWTSAGEVQVGSGLPQEQGLWVWVWHKSSWRRLPNNPTMV